METTTEQTNQTETWAEAAAASAVQDQEDRFPPRTFKRLLPVPLTEGELAVHARQAAKARVKVTEYETKKKAAVDDWKQKIEEAENDRDSHLDAISRGSIDRQVECIETREFRTGTVTVRRTDTGQTIESRPMTAGERQPDLPGTESAPESEEEQGAEASSKNGATEDGNVAAGNDGEETDEAELGGDDADAEDAENLDGAEITDPQAALDGASEDDDSFSESAPAQSKRVKKGSRKKTDRSSS